MSSYLVSAATYDGSSTKTNPPVFVFCYMNGAKVVAPIFWDAIQQAQNAGGAATVQRLIAVAFQNVVANAAPYLSAPVVPASDSPLPNKGHAAFQDSVCTAALVGSWTQ